MPLDWDDGMLSEEIARSIITGTFDIPADLDPATTLILKEIGKMKINKTILENIFLILHSLVTFKNN